MNITKYQRKSQRINDNGNVSMKLTDYRLDSCFDPFFCEWEAANRINNVANKWEAANRTNNKKHLVADG